MAITLVTAAVIGAVGWAWGLASLPRRVSKLESDLAEERESRKDDHAEVMAALSERVTHREVDFLSSQIQVMQDDIKELLQRIPPPEK